MSVAISVIMPAYNSEKYVGAAVESVLNQTFRDIELIVIDDCSTDGTYEILCDLAEKDSRIILHKNSLNIGVAESRNTGINLASGEAIALIDSDDIWEPEKLSVQYDVFKKGNRIVYSSYGFIDDEGQQIKRPFIVPETTNFKKMLTSNVIGNSTVFVDSDLLKKNHFSKDFFHEDYVLWMKLLKTETRAIGCKDVLVRYRVHKNSRSNNKAKAAVHRWKAYREGLGMNFFESVFAFAGYAVKGIFKYYLH